MAERGLEHTPKHVILRDDGTAMRCERCFELGLPDTPATRFDQKAAAHVCGQCFAFLEQIR